MAHTKTGNLCLVSSDVDFDPERPTWLPEERKEMLSNFK
jgi:hypothetical protein